MLQEGWKYHVVVTQGDPRKSLAPPIEEQGYNSQGAALNFAKKSAENGFYAEVIANSERLCLYFPHKPRKVVTA